MLYLLHLVLRCSSPEEAAVDLPLVCCRAHALPKLALPKLTTQVYFLYSSQTLSESQPRYGAPTHLLPCFLFVHVVLLDSSVRVVLLVSYVRV